jgi:hypothetical protein
MIDSDYLPSCVRFELRSELQICFQDYMKLLQILQPREFDLHSKVKTLGQRFTITPLYASWKHGWCLQRNHEPCGEHSLAETRADLSQSVGYLVLHHTYIALRRLFLVLSFIKLSLLDAWSSYYGTHTFKDTGGSDSSKVLSDPAAMGVRSAFVGCEDFLVSICCHRFESTFT